MKYRLIIVEILNPNLRSRYLSTDVYTIFKGKQVVVSNYNYKYQTTNIVVCHQKIFCFGS